jgi:hypothetical protein
MCDHPIFGDIPKTSLNDHRGVVIHYILQFFGNKIPLRTRDLFSICFKIGVYGYCRVFICY